MTYLTLASLTLAFLLAVSGIAKLRSPAATREAFTALRLPEVLRRSPAPAALPWLELLLAVVLAAGVGWLLIGGAVAALALFVAYTVVIGRALGFDEPVRCACFGTLGTHDVSTRTLVRNVVLVLLAVAAVVAAVLDQSVYTLGASGWGWVAVAALASAAVALSLGGAPGPVAGDGPGWLGGAVVTHVASGESIGIRSLAARHDGVVLLFVLAGCGSCERVIADLPEWRQRHPGREVVVLRAPGQMSDGWADLDLYEDPGFNLARALSGGYTPTAVELGRDGAPVGKVAVGYEPVTALLNATATPAPPEDESEATQQEVEADYVRRPIPDVVLLRSDGEPATARALASQQAQLLVGIDCLCTPARQAIDRLSEWQERLPILQVSLVVPFTMGGSELTERQGVIALYDHEGIASRALGLSGNVSAVLLGADGGLAGGPVSGLDEVEAFVSEIEEQIRLAAE